MSERNSSYEQEIDLGADPKWRSVTKSIWRFVRTQPLGTIGILVILTTHLHRSDRRNTSE